MRRWSGSPARRARPGSALVRHRREQREQGEGERGEMGLALPPAHLARIEAAEYSEPNAPASRAAGTQQGQRPRLLERGHESRDLAVRPSGCRCGARRQRRRGPGAGCRAARWSGARNGAGNPRCPCAFSSSAVAAKRGSGLPSSWSTSLSTVDLVDQVAAKIGFAEARPDLVVGVGELRHLDVGRDPAFLHRAARRRVVARGGQPERGLRRAGDEGLDRALAEAALAHDQRAVMVLERARRRSRRPRRVPASTRTMIGRPRAASPGSA